MSKSMEIISNVSSFIPQNLISEEISGIYGSDLLHDMGEIIKLYNIYDGGADFNPEGSKGDYIPSGLKYRKASMLVDKEARFLFAKSPDIKVQVDYTQGDLRAREQASTDSSIYQKFVDKVLKENQFNSALIKAAKDCFIGKRVAWMCNFDETLQKISFGFVSSLGFIAEYSDTDTTQLSKLICFYNMNDSSSRKDQRIYKKKYEMKNGYCYVSETIYDGSGEIVEEPIPEQRTLFTYIPGGVIINDGLTGDLKGSSDIERLADYESTFSKLANADIDAERKSMNPVFWTRDIDPGSTSNLSSSPGSYWDLQSDQNHSNDNVGAVGLLEPTMSYSSALETTLMRLTNTMYDEVDVPNIDLSTMSGVVSSGKGLKAIYWPLIVRCDEKMLAWKPAIEQIVKCIIDGAKLYPESAKPYLVEQLPESEYGVMVENQYPLPEDEADEKTIDLAQVSNNTMSIKSYMKKWLNMTDDEADSEIEQIARERQILENSYFPQGV